MVRYSYFNECLKKLRLDYGPRNIVAARDCGAVLVRNFRLPPKYGMDSTAVYLEVPHGYGYGVNILNSYILLKEETLKTHLVSRGDLTDVIEKQFQVTYNKKYLKGKKWFWICLHIWGSAEYDYYTGRKTEADAGDLVAMASEGRLREENIPAFIEDRTVGLDEHLAIIRQVLKLVADGDIRISREVGRMNDDRERILETMRRRADEFVFQNNWRNLKWMF